MLSTLSALCRAVNLFDSVLHTIVSIEWKRSDFDGLTKVFFSLKKCSLIFIIINIIGMSVNMRKKASANIHFVLEERNEL